MPRSDGSTIDAHEMEFFLHCVLRMVRRNGMAVDAKSATAATELGRKVVQRAAAECFAEADADGDGAITGEEFQRFVERVVLTPKLCAVLTRAAKAVAAESAMSRSASVPAKGMLKRFAGSGRDPRGRRRSLSGPPTAAAAAAAAVAAVRVRKAGPRTMQRGIARSPSFSDLERVLAGLGGDDVQKPADGGGADPKSRRRARRHSLSHVPAALAGLMGPPRGGLREKFGIGEVASTYVLTRRVQRGVRAKSVMLRQARSQAKSLYSGAEVRVLRQIFLSHAPKADPRMQFKHFSAMMREAYPRLDAQEDHGETVLSELFRVLDVNCVGVVTFSEVVRGISTLTRGAIEDKADLVFEVIDIDDDASLRTQDLVPFLTHGRRGFFLDHSNFAQRLFALIDENSDGVLSRSEVVTALSQHPLLYDCFVQLLAPGIDEAPEAVFRDSRRRASCFDMETLAVLFASCEVMPLLDSAVALAGTAGPASPERAALLGDEDAATGLSKARFRVFMTEHLRASAKMLPVLNRVFDVLDTDQSGYLSWREVFFGIEKMTGTGRAGNHEERCSWYFKVYDLDDSGRLDAADILSLLYSTGDCSDADVQRVTSMVEQFDKDNDGSVTLEEFTEATRREPHLLEAFGRMFGCDAVRSKFSLEAVARAGGGLSGMEQASAVAKSAAHMINVARSGRAEVSAHHAHETADKIVNMVVAHDSKHRLTGDGAGSKRTLHPTSTERAARAAAAKVGTEDIAELHSMALNLQQKAKLASEVRDEAGVIVDSATGVIARRRRSISRASIGDPMDHAAAAAAATAAHAAAQATATASSRSRSRRRASTRRSSAGMSTDLEAAARAAAAAAASFESTAEPTEGPHRDAEKEAQAAMESIQATVVRRAETIQSGRDVNVSASRRRRGSITRESAAEGAARFRAQTELLAEAEVMKDPRGAQRRKSGSGNMNALSMVGNEGALAAASSAVALQHARAVQSRLSSERNDARRGSEVATKQLDQLISPDGTSTAAARARRLQQQRFEQLGRDKEAEARRQWRLNAALDLSVDFELLREDGDDGIDDKEFGEAVADARDMAATRAFAREWDNAAGGDTGTPSPSPSTTPALDGAPAAVPTARSHTTTSFVAHDPFFAGAGPTSTTALPPVDGAESASSQEAGSGEERPATAGAVRRRRRGQRAAERAAASEAQSETMRLQRRRSSTANAAAMQAAAAARSAATLPDSAQVLAQSLDKAQSEGRPRSRSGYGYVNVDARRPLWRYNVKRGRGHSLGPRTPVRSSRHSLPTVRGTSSSLWSPDARGVRMPTGATVPAASPFVAPAGSLWERPSTAAPGSRRNHDFDASRVSLTSSKSSARPGAYRKPGQPAPAKALEQERRRAATLGDYQRLRPSTAGLSFLRYDGRAQRHRRR